MSGRPPTPKPPAPPYPFASASRVTPPPSKRRPSGVPARTAKAGASDIYGTTLKSPKLVLEVWESADGIRRVLVEILDSQHWRVARLQRATTAIAWDPPAQVVKVTMEPGPTKARGKVRSWCIYGR